MKGQGDPYSLMNTQAYPNPLPLLAVEPPGDVSKCASNSPESTDNEFMVGESKETEAWRQTWRITKTGVSTDGNDRQ